MVEFWTLFLILSVASFACGFIVGGLTTLYIVAKTMKEVK